MAEKKLSTDANARPIPWAFPIQKANDVKDNAEATATVAAVAAQKHCLVGIIASYSAAKIGLLTVKQGTTTLWTVDVHNSIVIPMNPGYEFDTNTAINVTLSASGTGGVNGRVTILYGTLYANY